MKWKTMRSALEPSYWWCLLIYIIEVSFHMTVGLYIYIFLLLCQKLYLYHTIELFHITPKSLSKLFAKEKLVAMWDMGNWRSYSIKHNKMGIFFYWYSSGKTLKRRQINEYWGIHTEGLSLLVRGHIRNQLCVYRQGHINWFQITFWVVYR